MSSRNATFDDVVRFLGLDTLFAEMVLALGLALLGGNAFAIWRWRRGRPPEGAGGELRTSRAAFLMAVGAVMAVWGAVSMLA